MFKYFKHWNFQLKFGVLVLAIFLILGFIAPIFIQEDPMLWGTYPKNLSVSWEHPLGTTDLGQDTFALLTLSIRNSVTIGTIVSIFGTILGVALGLISGFSGGITDRVITVFMDSFIVIPSMPILILMSSMITGDAALVLFIIILIIFSWSWPARQVRAMAMSLRERDFICTSQFSGNSTGSVLFHEVLPFVSSWSISYFINGILFAIGAESGLAVIGMSMNDMPTLGTMIYWANQHQAMLRGDWLWIGTPTVAITPLFLALFLTVSGYQALYAKRRGKDA